MQCAKKFVVKTMGKNSPTPKQIEHPHLEMILTKEIDNFQTLISEEWSSSKIDHNICEEILWDSKGKQIYLISKT